jgi:sialate O-acetylesterase
MLGSALRAELTPNSLFTDNAVLQRDMAMPVWGMATAGATVSVTLDGQTATATATAGQDGKWMAHLKPHAAGGPFTMTITGEGTTLTINNTLVGDVWLCSGQSNMQMQVNDAANAEIVRSQTSNFPTIRLLSVPLKGTAQPVDSFDAKWTPCTPASVGKFSAVAYFFGTELSKAPALAKVPIGLIESAFGGSPVEGWIPGPDLASLALRPDQIVGCPLNLPASGMFNAMIHPLVPCGLAGVLWYQGESNAGKSDLYAKLLSTMIGSWRTAWASPDLPFFLVQLPPFAERINGYYYSGLREAQAAVARSVPHTDLAVTIDTADGSNLHPPEKFEVGRRLALLALRDVYHQTVTASGPVFQKSSIASDGSVTLTFDPQGNALASRSPGQLRGFELAGNDGVYHAASGYLDGSSVMLRSDAVPQPQTIRYAWGGVPLADLINDSGLPASPFRTDTESIPKDAPEFQTLGADYRIATPDYTLVVSAQGKVTSLVVKGKQFLSNADGASGGSSVPLFGGSLDFTKVARSGPDSLHCSNATITLDMTCSPKGMQWKLKSEDQLELSFRLAFGVQVKATIEGQGVLLERGDAKLRIDGSTDLSPANEDGQMLNVKMPHNQEVTLDFTLD